MTASRWFRRVVVCAFAAVCAAGAWADAYTWSGGTGDWSTPANWTVGGETATRVPGADDDVVLPAPETTAGNYVVTAKEAINVASLTVGSDTAGTDCLATFESQTNGTHRIGGNLVVNKGGVMTHTVLPGDANAPEDECYKLNLSVGGNVTVAAGARLDVAEKGYSDGKGPGVIPANTKGVFVTVSPVAIAVHGGTPVEGKSYGSVSSPTNCGSGAVKRGGGAIRIDAGGTVAVNGVISADGEARPGDNWRSGAGGSVWITCAALEGSSDAVIRADGGKAIQGWTGSGGRVSVCQTAATDFSAYKGAVTACGGGGTYSGSPSGSAGTVYLKSARGLPTVIVDNSTSVSGKENVFVELCARNECAEIGNLLVRDKGCGRVARGDGICLFGDWTIGNTGVSRVDDAIVCLEGTNTTTISGTQTIDGFACRNKAKSLRVKDGVTLKLAVDSSIGDIDLATDNVTLNVGTNMLTVYTRTHKDGKHWADSLDNLVVKETDPPTGKTGDIIWKASGFVLSVR